MRKPSNVGSQTVSLKSLGDGLYAVENAAERAFEPDEKLSAIVGSRPLPRSELTKKLWDYIKKNGRQDKKKRTMINADDSLRPVFNGKSQVSMFEMAKLVSGHIR
jgi:chromatin remodeling complex protein RSC6